MPAKKSASALKTLAIDIGGTGIKSFVLDASGKALTERIRVATPQPATPKAVLQAIASLAKQSGPFDRIGAGFPGVVKQGTVKTAPHLDHKKWQGVRLNKELERLLGKPARVANDAVVQGYAAITGKGIELVITLGTSMGSAIYIDGHALPMEMGHHPFRHGEYEDEVGNDALKRFGKKKWNKHLLRVIDQLYNTFNYDRLYIGGGNSSKISFELPDNVRVIDNADGLLGVAWLWRQ